MDVVVESSCWCYCWWRHLSRHHTPWIVPCDVWRRSGSTNVARVPPWVSERRRLWETLLNPGGDRPPPPLPPIRHCCATMTLGGATTNSMVHRRWVDLSMDGEMIGTKEFRRPLFPPPPPPRRCCCCPCAPPRSLLQIACFGWRTFWVPFLSPTTCR